MPSDVLRVAKVTKILLAMDNGTITSIGEKTLDEINVAELEVAEDLSK